MLDIAGILTILLQCPATTLSDDQISLVIRTAHCLIALSDEHGGHLPSSVPFRQHPEGELVQICHGAPGILLLCAALLNHHGPLSQKHASALQRACNVTWNEGLLKKGLGICHGVTGNAWSLLLLGNSTGLEPSERNLCTSRALSMLLHATSLPPLADVHAACHSPYHIPDHPQSLFEGLAGAVCAWSEAATYLQYRLNTSCADTTLLPPCIKPLNTLTMLGIPGLGGCGSVGIL